jgi:hypothetical protein
MKLDWKIIWEAVKEPLREAVLAVIPLILAWLGTITAPWAIALYAILRFIDSYLHEHANAQPAKTRNEGIGGVTGLTGF